MGSGILSKNLIKLIKWRADIPLLYPSENRDLHLQMWWIRWGAKMYKNIPFWRCVSGEFMYEYVYEIPKKIKKIDFLPLQELMLIIADNEDKERLRENYIDYMTSEGISKYFGVDIELKILVCKIFKISFNFKLENDVDISLYNEEGVYDVILIGNARDDTGLGVDKITISDCIKSCGLNVLILSNDEVFRHRCGLLFLALPAPSVYIHFLKDINAYSESALIAAHTPWELEKVPDVLREDIDRLNLIYCQSKFVMQGYERFGVASCKLKYLPPVIDVGGVSSKKELEQKEASVFKVIVPFDLSSYQTRKNPFAAVQAYISAFPNANEASLCIKINSKEYENEQYRLLEDYLQNLKRADIWIAEGVDDRGELLKFYSKFDCLLHLHRSEGFGRNIAEFMKLGIPVVCTSYSGNMDYCGENNSYLVDYKLVSVGAHEYIYTDEAVWANPSIESASRCLIEVKNNINRRESVIVNACKDIERYNINNAREMFVKGLL